MKSLVSIVIMLFFATIFNCCSQSMLNSIPAGFISSEEHMDQDSFQDYVDYCKYTYSSADIFKKHSKYQRVTADKIPEIRGYFSNFKAYMSMDGRLREYDFDPSCINEGDYCRIETEGEKYSDYTLWYFDIESLTLYYIHANI